MATSTFNIAIVLSAIDRMSGVINSGVNQSIASLDKMKKAGQENLMKGAGMFGSGIAVAAAMKPALDAYEELEAAQAKMASRVMRAGGGIDKTILSALNAESERLGNKLPGTTAELTDMFTVMLENGVDAKRIIDGLGAATADFAVVAGMAYPDAADFVARMSVKMGIAGDDAERFLDVLNRTKQSGVKVDELGYAFGGVGGALKSMGMSGYESFRKIAPIMGELVKLQGGESSGTSMTRLLSGLTNTKKLEKANDLMRSFGASTLNFLDKTGKWKGEDNMFVQFEKISKLTQGQQRVIKDIFSGDGKDAAAFARIVELMANGMEKYNKELKASEDRAAVSEQLKVQLETFKAMKESASGTWTNALAAMAESLKPEIIAITKALGAMAKWIQEMAKEHPGIFKFIGTFMALTSAILMVTGAILAAKGVMLLLSVMSLATPVGWALALAGAGALVAANWQPVSDAFRNIIYGAESEGGGMAVWSGRIRALIGLVKTLGDMLSVIWNTNGNFSEDWKEIKDLYNKMDSEALYRSGRDEYIKKRTDSDKAKANASKQTGYAIHYNPVITIQGNADKSVVMDALYAHSSDLHEKQRKSFTSIPEILGF